MPKRLKPEPDDNWQGMMEFAIELIGQSARHAGTGFMGERIIILHLNHANELLMKAFLIRKGYIVSYLEKDKIRDGVKQDEFLDKSKTIDYGDCLKLVLQNVHTSEKNKEEIKKRMLRFNQIRNEIQHRSTHLPFDKGEEIDNFYPYFQELFNLMFGDMGLTLNFPIRS